jgi:hypothetical protein
MTATFRTLAALALVIGVLFALPGCGGGKPSADNKGDGKDKKGGDPNPGGSSGNTNSGQPVVPSQPAKVDITTGVGKEAVDFLQAVVGRTATAEQLSTNFKKSVGLPIVFEGDKAKGYSAGSAEDWLKKFGASTRFGLPLSATQVGDVALFRGALVEKQGTYSLRMVKEGSAWKVDWLSASSVSGPTVLPGAGTGDAVLQEFAAASLTEVICDKDALPPDVRAMVIAAGLSPALRAAWAPPFDMDKPKGYDFSVARMTVKANELGDKAESVSCTSQGDATFRVEITRAGGAKSAYLVKVAKAPGQWLIEGFNPA